MDSSSEQYYLPRYNIGNTFYKTIDCLSSLINKVDTLGRNVQNIKQEITISTGGSSSSYAQTFLKSIKPRYVEYEKFNLYNSNNIIQTLSSTGSNIFTNNTSISGINSCTLNVQKNFLDFTNTTLNIDGTISLNINNEISAGQFLPYQVVTLILNKNELKFGKYTLPVTVDNREEEYIKYGDHKKSLQIQFNYKTATSSITCQLSSQATIFKLLFGENKLSTTFFGINESPFATFEVVPTYNNLNYILSGGLGQPQYSDYYGVVEKGITNYVYDELSAHSYYSLNIPIVQTIQKASYQYKYNFIHSNKNIITVEFISNKNEYFYPNFYLKKDQKIIYNNQTYLKTDTNIFTNIKDSTDIISQQKISNEIIDYSLNEIPSEKATATYIDNKLNDLSSAISGVIADAGGGISVGSIFIFTGIKPPNGAFALNGQELQNVQYNYIAFWNFLIHNASSQIISIEEYNSKIKETGQCGYFGQDALSTYIKLPTLTGFIQNTINITELGKTISAGLPNISGQTISNDGAVAYSPYAIGYTGKNNDIYSKGALYLKKDTQKKITGGLASSNKDREDAWLAFDASKANSIYGNSNTVQPPAIKYQYCIQVYNAKEAETILPSGCVLNILYDTLKAIPNHIIPIGTIITYAGTDIPDGWHSLNGTSNTYSTDSEFFKWVKTATSGFSFSGVNAEQLYNTELANNGSCGKFIYQDTGYVRFPTINCFLQNDPTSAVLGSYISAGLPNITGGYNDYISNVAGQWGALLYNDDDNGNQRGQIPQCGKAWVTHSGFKFDASKANSIYGKSDTVQPPSIKYQYLIFTGENTSAIKFDRFDRLDQIKIEHPELPETSGITIFQPIISNNNVPITSQEYIISSYNNADKIAAGTESLYYYYKIYNTGWIEQGGQAIFNVSNKGYDSEGTITLPIAMKDTHYCIYVTLKSTRGGAGSISAYPKTASIFNWFYDHSGSDSISTGQGQFFYRVEGIKA